MKSIILFSNDALNWSKVTVTNFTLLRKISILNKSCYFKLSIHPKSNGFHINIKLQLFLNIKMILAPLHSKNAGLFFFYPNAGFSLLGHFIGLVLIFLPRCWVILTLGIFLPNRWVDPVSGQQLLRAQLFHRRERFSAPLPWTWCTLSRK